MVVMIIFLVLTIIFVIGTVFYLNYKKNNVNKSIKQSSNNNLKEKGKK